MSFPYYPIYSNTSPPGGTWIEKSRDNYIDHHLIISYERVLFFFVLCYVDDVDRSACCQIIRTNQSRRKYLLIPDELLAARGPK